MKRAQSSNTTDKKKGQSMTTKPIQQRKDTTLNYQLTFDANS